jgi:hypothetical protein
VRILYGISSGGPDCTLRARTVATELVARGHELRVATAGGIADELVAGGLDVIDLEGDVELALERALGFAPDLVLTDQSYFACLVAYLARVPVFPIARGTPRARAESYIPARRGWLRRVGRARSAS